MDSAHTEGVIKFHLTHHSTPLEPGEYWQELNAWRSILFQLQFIGHDVNRYMGLGFGNISTRLDAERFLITGSQTGGCDPLTLQQYCRIIHADPHHNQIESEGLISPSSETLTHAAIYQIDPRIRAVIHVHHPLLWQQAETLKLPATAAHIPYGTPQMAKSVQHLIQEQIQQTHGLFAMQGHEDGIISFGINLPQAAGLLLNAYAQALALPPEGVIR